MNGNNSNNVRCEASTVVRPKDPKDKITEFGIDTMERTKLLRHLSLRRLKTTLN
jgi:hypothetical protein